MIDLKVIKNFECPRCGLIFEKGTSTKGRRDDEFLEFFCEDCIFYFEVEEDIEVTILSK